MTKKQRSDKTWGERRSREKRLGFFLYSDRHTHYLCYSAVPSTGLESIHETLRFHFENLWASSGSLDQITDLCTLLSGTDNKKMWKRVNLL